jgi:hypothetical protein
MIKIIRYSTMLLLLTITVFIIGCTDKLEEASILCADLDNITDPAQKERLTKECPSYISGQKEPVEPKPNKAVPEPVKQKPLKVEIPELKKQKHSKWFKPSPVVNW